MLLHLYTLGRSLRWKISASWAKLIFKSCKIPYGSNLNLKSAPIIVKLRSSSIVLGDNVTISNEINENPAGVVHKTVLAAARPGAELIIGNNVGISGAILFCHQRIEIGDDCLIGAGASIYDTDFHALDPAERHVRHSNQMKTAPVRLGHNVWLGAQSLVLRGVIIGDNAVVGARAVVTKDVPANAIVGGIPARVIGWVPGHENSAATHSPDRGEIA